MSAYTTVAKPTDLSYTTVAKPTDLSYTTVAKPTGGSFIQKGMYLGSLGLTYSISRDASLYTIIPKPLS